MTETRTQRMAARAAARLRGLLLILAPDGRCAKCKKKKPLEVDHVDGCAWSARRRNRNRWTKVSILLREYRENVPLRALCRSCNGRDGAKRFQGKQRKRDVVQFNERPAVTFDARGVMSFDAFGVGERDGDYLYPPR